MLLKNFSHKFCRVLKGQKMRVKKLGFFRWYRKTLRRQYKRAKVINQIKRENPTVTIEDDVVIISPQNLVLGKNVLIRKGTILHCGGQAWCNYQGKIVIGDNCQIGHYCILIGAGEIEIKSGSELAMGVKLIAQKADMAKFEGRDLTSSETPLRYGKIVLQEGVRIAVDALILAGVTLGRGAIIAPGAIIYKDVPDFKMVFAARSDFTIDAPRGYLNPVEDEESG